MNEPGRSVTERTLPVDVDTPVFNERPEESAATLDACRNRFMQFYTLLWRTTVPQ